MKKVASHLCLCSGIAFFFLLSNGNAIGMPISDAPAAIYLYVSPSGNDQWSGSIPSPNSTNTDGPFATLGRARDAVRKLKAGGEGTQCVVAVRGGKYHLTETLILGTEDSGTEAQPTIFKAYGDEKPILTGTKTITSFETYQKGIIKASLKGILPESYSFKQLFAKGKRQVLARFPNYDPRDPIGGGFLYVEASVADNNKSRFKFREGSVPDWKHTPDCELFIYPGPNYWNDILSVKELDHKNGIVTLAEQTSFAIKAGNRFYFRNLLEALDTPGEWYFDRGERMLYFWPIDDSALKGVEVPILKSIIEITSDKKRGMPEHIRIEGFTIEGCEGTAVVLNGTKNVLIAKNQILNASGNGINVQGGMQNSIIGNDIYEVGGTGISITAGDRKTLTAGESRAENNYVHHTGIFRKNSTGINCAGVGNTISHNLIHSVPRTGISFDGNDHVIEYNHVHHVNQETQDSGVIYTCARDWTKRGNIVRFNYVHDSGGYGRNTATDNWKTPFYTWGIYLDDWTSGTSVYGNVVARSYYGGVVVHAGRDNIIENNIILNGLLEQVRFQDWPPTNPLLPGMYKKIQEMGYTRYPDLASIKDPTTGAQMAGNKFLRNIVYYTSKNSTLYYVSKTINVSQNVYDYNTVYNDGRSPIIPYVGKLTAHQWETWKEQGPDKNSIVADPLLRDAANDNVELLPNSPALKQGFKPIPFDKIGPYKDPLRASWPINND